MLIQNPSAHQHANYAGYNDDEFSEGNGEYIYKFHEYYWMSEVAKKTSARDDLPGIEVGHGIYILVKGHVNKLYRN
jgi:hypothetical protein